jgi:hypothetical protein
MGATEEPALTCTPRLIEVDAGNFDTLPCCGIKCPTHLGRRQKDCWLHANSKFGCTRKHFSPRTANRAAIEYLPGEFAWRGVDAGGYMFIHCVWIYSRQHQRKGWGSAMIEACLNDAKEAGMHGVAVMVRGGPWLADSRLFLANAPPVDTAPPDYQLLVRKFNNAPNPAFKKDWDRKVARYGRGLTIVRSSQCPHIAKFASDIAQTAAEEYRIRPRVVDLESWSDAQNAPTPYATFAVIYNGRLLADHQISRTRFRTAFANMHL